MFNCFLLFFFWGFVGPLEVGVELLFTDIGHRRRHGAAFGVGRGRGEKGRQRAGQPLPFTPHAWALASAGSVRPPPSGALSLTLCPSPWLSSAALEAWRRGRGWGGVPAWPWLRLTYGGERVAASGGQAARLPPSGSALQLDAPSPGADSSSTSSSRRGQNYDSYCFLNFYFLIEG